MRIDIGGAIVTSAIVTSAITSEAAEELGLAEGQEAYAAIEACDVMIGIREAGRYERARLSASLAKSRMQGPRPPT